MSDLVPCPTCGTTLRLPATAVTVRCPKCKTLLQVVDEAAPPVAPPLPFAGAAKPKPAKPVAATRAANRPQVVDEAAEEARAAVERKRDMRRELREMDAEQEVADDRYEEVKEECGWGRMALGWLQYGMAGYAVGVLLVFFAMLGFVVFTSLGTPLGTVMVPVALLGMALGTIATLVLMVGFGLALRGPKMPRHIAVFGLAAAGLQVLAVAATLGSGIGRVQNLEADAGPTEGFAGADVAYYVLGLCTNLFLLADTPTRLALSYKFPVLGVVAGVFEFARLVFVCQLVQTYADLGKNDRASADAGKGISRVFWVLLLTCMFRFAISMGCDWFPQQDTMWLIGQVLHVLLFVAAFGFLGFRLLVQIQVIRDTAETLLADRVSSTATKLDVV